MFLFVFVVELVAEGARALSNWTAQVLTGDCLCGDVLVAADKDGIRFEVVNRHGVVDDENEASPTPTFTVDVFNRGVWTLGPLIEVFVVLLLLPVSLLQLMLSVALLKLIFSVDDVVD